MCLSANDSSWGGSASPGPSGRGRGPLHPQYSETSVPLPESAKTQCHRVVILAPAAADIFSRLGAADSVVGVTDSVSGFPHAAMVGTHMNPGLENIAALRPGLIVAGTRFSPELAERMGAKLFVYAPKNLDEIIGAVRAVSRTIGREKEGERLAKDLQSVLDNLSPPRQVPSVLYEVRAAPLSLAVQQSVMRDLLERAGMRYAYKGDTALVSVEHLMARPPDIYIYQQGPMNKNPTPPRSRPGWENFAACIWKVKEFDFARPNTRLFESLQSLNAILHQGDFCRAGTVLFPE